MKQIIIGIGVGLLMVLALFVGSRYYYHSPLYKKITSAIAIVTPTKGNSATGVVHFVQQSDGILVTATISGLTPGKHGFHIHEFGNCACDDANCAGDHFNPTAQPHGAPDAAHRHVGDLGNIIADEQGVGQYSYTDKQIALNGPDSIIGRAVIIHADPDDLVSQPSGNAGKRIGCGVVGIAK